MRFLPFLLLFVVADGYAQSYTSYRTGADTSIVTDPMGGTCLMGGATEDDNAMRWFLQRADGGDVLVLRASGSDGYNDYFYDELGVALHSVETLVLHAAAATQEAYVRQRIAEAEAVWLAGGNQATYVDEWRGPNGLDSLLNAAVNVRGAVIGGTSAGMAILGQGYFAATNGTVTSTEAIAAPFAPAVSVDTTAFLRLPYLERIITDTHFDNPDRRGRHLVFLARLYDENLPYRGIACEEYTAVCIDATGRARVFGDHPTYDDFAYFIRPNCTIPEGAPETLTPNAPLQWDHDGRAVHTYRIPGTAAGTHTFDLPTWTGTGGTDLFWSVNGAEFHSQAGEAITCTTTATSAPSVIDLQVFPNPTNGSFILQGEIPPDACTLYTATGKSLQHWSASPRQLDLSNLPDGWYVLRWASGAVVRVVIR